MPVHDWSRIDTGLFRHFQHCWIGAICEALNDGTLPAEYYALAEQIAGGLGPDVLTLANGTGGSTNGSAPNGRLTAVAELMPKVRFVSASDPLAPPTRRWNIAVRHSSDDRVVALVEIVSPGNKSSQHAVRSFLDKFTYFMDNGVHFLILDLHPPGPRDPQGIHGVAWAEYSNDPFTLPADKPLTFASYDAGPPRCAYVEPVAVGDALPDMPLFLEPGAYVSVPLELAYLDAWNRVPMRWRRELEGPST